MYKKTGLAFFSFITAASVLTGCGAKNTAGAAEAPAVNKSDKLSVVCTIFPEYDWVREIMGSHTAEADITYLLDSGTDLHNFQPTASDIMKISTCDIDILIV